MLDQTLLLIGLSPDPLTPFFKLVTVAFMFLMDLRLLTIACKDPSLTGCKKTLMVFSLSLISSKSRLGRRKV